jgi:hypothetical protein
MFWAVGPLAFKPVAAPRCERGMAKPHLGDLPIVCPHQETEPKRYPTNARIDTQVVDGEAVLIVRIKCQCGWTDQRIIQGEGFSGEISAET